MLSSIADNNKNIKTHTYEKKSYKKENQARHCGPIRNILETNQFQEIQQVTIFTIKTLGKITK